MKWALGATLFACTAAVAPGCHRPPAAPPPRVAEPSPPLPPPARSLLRGELVTWLNGSELGRQRFDDDGETLHSTVSLARATYEVTLQRSPRRVRLIAGGQTVDHDLGTGSLALANGDWQSLALAAEWFPDSATPRALEVFVATSNATVPGSLTVRPSQDQPGHRLVNLTVGGVELQAVVDPEGRVVRVRVPSQGVEVLPEGTAPTQVRTPRTAPSSVTSEALEVTRDGVTLRGELWRPAGASGPLPVVVFIAGSGPTDRDCNQPPALLTDTYWWMASALAERGIASVRYDKRGVGRSGREFTPSEVTLQDFVADAAALVRHLRADPRTASVTLAGHSEGGLLALLVARDLPVDALALLASPGRPLGALVREQLSRQLDEGELAAADAAMQAVREGRPLDGVPPALRPLFNPAVARFLRSALDVDPSQVFRGLRVPAVILQGETDAQVTVTDARALAAARPDARLVLLPRTNHVFRVEASSALPQASYTNPDLPLAPGVVDALVSAVPRPGPRPRGERSPVH